MIRIQHALFRLLAAGVAVLGVVLILARTDTAALLLAKWASLLGNPATLKNTAVLALLGVALLGIGVFGLIPAALLNGRRKTLTVSGTHGRVVIQLKPVEASLSKVIGAMPEVKRIQVGIHPSSDGTKVRITGEALVYKGGGIQATAARINDAIEQNAAAVFGMEAIASVDLTIKGIIVGSETRSDTDPASRQAPATPTASESAAERPAEGERPVPGDPEDTEQHDSTR